MLSRFSTLLLGVFLVGFYLGVRLYRGYAIKHHRRVALAVLNDVAEHEGYIAFSDEAMSIHFLDPEAFASLMDNILEAYESETIM
jgi:hypothetical protein